MRKKVKHVLIDTNILVYLTYAQSIFQASAQQAIKTEILSGTQLYVTMQVLREYAKVMTGAKDETTGKPYRDIEATVEAIRQFRENMKVIGDDPKSFDKWLEFIDYYDAKGRSVFDTQIAAQMIQNNITHILTNDERFTRYSNIITIIPLPKNNQ